MSFQLNFELINFELSFKPNFELNFKPNFELNFESNFEVNFELNFKRVFYFLCSDAVLLLVRWSVYDVLHVSCFLPAILVSIAYRIESWAGYSRALFALRKITSVSRTSTVGTFSQSTNTTVSFIHNNLLIFVGLYNIIQRLFLVSR